MKLLKIVVTGERHVGWTFQSTLGSLQLMFDKGGNLFLAREFEVFYRLSRYNKFAGWVRNRLETY